MIQKDVKKIALSLVFIFPLAICLKDILSGAIPFWYDPARDFLAAWENLKKPTLLGPPTGIPGIFYGPYWIWLISIGLLISKNPRFIVILIQTLPYFTIFPFILFKLRESYGEKIFLLLWLLFIFSYKNYTTYLWNPHLAPLIFLILIYLIIKPPLLPQNKTQHLKLGLAGFMNGLLTNFHMAFGIGIGLAVLLFIALKGKSQKQTMSKRAKAMVLFIGGLIISLLPSIAFEIRHGFNQSKTVIKIITQAAQGISEITLEGFSPIQILQYFFTTPERLFLIPRVVLGVTYAVAVFCILQFIFLRKVPLSKIEKRLTAFLCICSISVLAIFLTARNPVWHYHFIGVEIIFLLLTGLLISKSSTLQKVVGAWVVYLLIINVSDFVKSLNDNPLAIQSLASKELIVNQIYQDAAAEPFSVLAYSPSIYTYDFDYLFKWIAEKHNTEEPKTELTQSQPTYLIIPETSKAIELDFINYKTPNDQYQTSKEWRAADGTLVMKRQSL